jgi:polar amino acid transport system substrate-binding protein
MRQISLIIFIALAILFFNLTDSQAGKFEDIKDQGFIRVGVALGGEPVGFRDKKNQPVGYDVDFAKRLANKLGVELRMVPIHGDARISMLVSKQLDVVIGNLTVTDARQKIIDFSDAYFRTSLRIAIQKGSNIKTLKDLAGKKVVVGRGTSGATFLEEAAPDAELVYTDQFAPNGLLLLRQKRVDAGIEDSSFVDFMIARIDSLDTMPGDFLSGDIGIGIRKGEPEFVKWINEFVAEYIHSGDYEKNYKKWWGEDAIPPKISRSLEG